MKAGNYASSKLENIWVFLTHHVNDIDLLQGLSNCVFVLGVTWYISGPELQEKRKHNHTQYGTDCRLWCVCVCVCVPVLRGAPL